MKNLIFTPVLFFLFTFLCVINFFSCNEDPVTTSQSETPYQYDSARFNWKVDTLEGGTQYLSLWARDSNDVFVTNNSNKKVYRIQNGKKTVFQNPGNSFIGFLNNDENNDGYLVSTKLIGNLYQPFIQKFNGNTFIEIPNPQDLKKNLYLNSSYVKNANEIWMGSDSFIVKFDGVKLITYTLDVLNFKIRNFYVDELSNLKLLGYIHHLDIDKTEHMIYEFTGSDFVRVYSDLETPRPKVYRILNKEVSATDGSSLFSLTDSVLVPQLQIVPPNSFYYDGYSFENLFVSGYVGFEGYYSTMFHWNGYKWSIENSEYKIDYFSTKFFMIDQNLYYAIANDDFGNTFVMRGLKK